MDRAPNGIFMSPQDLLKHFAVNLALLGTTSTQDYERF